MNPKRLHGVIAAIATAVDHGDYFEGFQHGSQDSHQTPMQLTEPHKTKPTSSPIPHVDKTYPSALSVSMHMAIYVV